jgi:hypothetical protein
MEQLLHRIGEGRFHRSDLAQIAYSLAKTKRRRQRVCRALAGHAVHQGCLGARDNFSRLNVPLATGLPGNVSEIVVTVSWKWSAILLRRSLPFV